MAKHFATHLVYVLYDTQEDKYYIGSHNANRKQYTEIGILSQSGNPLQKIAVKTHDWDSYYNRVKLLHVIQCTDEEVALGMEQQLINLFFIIFPKEKMLNKTMTANKPSHQYSYEHTEEWKSDYASKLRKPKAYTSLRGKKNGKTAETVID